MPIPVIIVGNLTVGGSGKTPIVLALAQWLSEQGEQPGIISRGYAGKLPEGETVRRVQIDDSAQWVGDEALLLVRRGQCPVAVAKRRVEAARLLYQAGCTVLISDDGLQHYALQRDIEIAVIDPRRGYGNRYCLPAGPLREPVNRSVDFVLYKNALEQHSTETVTYTLENLRRVDDDSSHSELDALKGQTVHAVAGIGNPTRFFQSLRDAGLQVIEHVFPDHHVFQVQEIDFGDQHVVIMTEKDAVKCRGFVDQRHLYLPITAHLPIQFTQKLKEKLSNG